MTPAQADAMPARLAHELTVAYGERLRFEAQVVADAVWGRNKKKEPAADGASDDELADFMSIG